MVRVEEVQDESEKLRQQGLEVPRDDEDEWEATDSDEDEQSDDEDEVDERGIVLANESLWDRIFALKDIVSPLTRAEIAKTWNTTCSYSYFGGWIAGKIIWIGVTSALLVGLPFALAVEDESRITAQEKEIMGQTQAQGGVAPGSAAAMGMPAGGNGQQGLRPPGF